MGARQIYTRFWRKESSGRLRREVHAKTPAAERGVIVSGFGAAAAAEEESERDILRFARS